MHEFNRYCKRDMLVLLSVGQCNMFDNIKLNFNIFHIKCVKKDIYCCASMLFVLFFPHSAHTPTSVCCCSFLL